QHGKLGQRMHPHLVEHMPGEGSQSGLVDIDPGLVGDLDAHMNLEIFLGKKARVAVTTKVTGSCSRRAWPGWLAADRCRRRPSRRRSARKRPRCRRPACA